MLLPARLQMRQVKRNGNVWLWQSKQQAHRPGYCISEICKKTKNLSFFATFMILQKHQVFFLQIVFTVWAKNDSARISTTCMEFAVFMRALGTKPSKKPLEMLQKNKYSSHISVFSYLLSSFGY